MKKINTRSKDVRQFLKTINVTLVFDSGRGLAFSIPFPMSLLKDSRVRQIVKKQYITKRTIETLKNAPTRF